MQPIGSLHKDSDPKFSPKESTLFENIQSRPSFRGCTERTSSRRLPRNFYALDRWRLMARSLGVGHEEKQAQYMKDSWGFPWWWDNCLCCTFRGWNVSAMRVWLVTAPYQLGVRQEVLYSWWTPHLILWSSFISGAQLCISLAILYGTPG